MNDQISEKMARKYFSLGCSPTEWTRQKEDSFVYNLRACGIIKPSKLDEAREWARKKSVYPPSHGPWEIGYTDGVRDATERFESAIAEILEDKS